MLICTWSPSRKPFWKGFWVFERACSTLYTSKDLNSEDIVIRLWKTTNVVEVKGIGKGTDKGRELNIGSKHEEQRFEIQNGASIFLVFRLPVQRSFVES